MRRSKYHKNNNNKIYITKYIDENYMMERAKFVLLAI